MTKKGFVFLESVVVLVVVALSLTMLITSYSLISRKTKEKENYNRPSDKYLLYNISTLGTSEDCNYYTKSTCGNFINMELYRNMDCSSEANKEQCDKISAMIPNWKSIFEDYNIEYLYVVDNVREVLRQSDSVKKYDNGTIEYMKTLKKCNTENVDEDGNYINKNEIDADCDDPITYMIGAFRRNGDYYYASIKLTTLKSYAAKNVPVQVTVNVNGAINETITYSGTSSGTIKLNNKGKGTATMLTGEYTFKSNVARMPAKGDYNKDSVYSNSSYLYTKNVTITGPQTVNFYPEGSIYWYGNGSIEGSSLFSKCGGIYWKYSDVNGDHDGTYKKVAKTNSDGFAYVEANWYSVRMTSSGGQYYSKAKCSKSFSKGSYSKVHYILQRAEATPTEDRTEPKSKLTNVDSNYKMFNGTYNYTHYVKTASNKSMSLWIYVLAKNCNCKVKMITYALWLE